MAIGLVLVLAAGLGASDPAPAAQAAPAAIQKAQSADDRIVCRIIVPTGSRLGSKRVCKTRAEWDAVARRAADQVSDLQTRALTGDQMGH